MKKTVKILLPYLVQMQAFFSRLLKSSTGFAVSRLANFGLVRDLYSKVSRSSTCISLSFFCSSGLPDVTGNFTFLKNPWPVLSPSHLFIYNFLQPCGNSKNIFCFIICIFSNARRNFYKRI